MSKPIVIYLADQPHFAQIGSPASIYVLNHPTQGSTQVTTTVVQKYDPRTRIFETRNTIYQPAGLERRSAHRGADAANALLEVKS